MGHRAPRHGKHAMTTGVPFHLLILIHISTDKATQERPRKRDNGFHMKKQTS